MLWHPSAEHKDFTVDFAHPIDNKLATFLQSPASVDSLVLGGSLLLSAEGAPAAGAASTASPRASARHSARRSQPEATAAQVSRLRAMCSLGCLCSVTLFYFYFFCACVTRHLLHPPLPTYPIAISLQRHTMGRALARRASHSGTLHFSRLLEMQRV